MKKITHEEIVKHFELQAYMNDCAVKVNYSKGRKDKYGRLSAIYSEAIRRLEEHAERTKKTNELLTKLAGKKRAARRRGRQGK